MLRYINTVYDTHINFFVSSRDVDHKVGLVTKEASSVSREINDKKSNTCITIAKFKYHLLVSRELT